MKYNNIFKYGAFAVAAISMMMLASCDTNVESINLNEPSIEAQNPKLYENYLTNLRKYKAGNHTLVYVSFDNRHKTPGGRADHVTDLPDSVDVVNLNHPTDLADWEIQDIADIRSKKGIKVVYTVDFDAIKKAYNEKVANATDTEPVNVDFESFLVDTLKTAVSYVEKYNYNGIIVAYQGKSRLHMLPDELKEYTANEVTFIKSMTDWKNRYQDKMVSFLGCPQNLIDPSFTDLCDNVLIDGSAAISQDALTFIYAQSEAKGVSPEKYGMVVSCYQLSDPNKVAGYFSDGSLAMTGLADWATESHSGLSVSAVGVLGAQDDYFNPDYVYSNVRALIQSVNPSIK